SRISRAATSAARHSRARFTRGSGSGCTRGMDGSTSGRARCEQAAQIAIDRSFVAHDNRAMLRGRNIVCVSTIDWSFLWQEHQGVMSVFAGSGNRVLFIENTGVRAPGWRDANRITTRLRKWLSGEGRFGPVAANSFFYSPLALPLPYSRLAQRINRVLVCSSIRRWLERNAFEDPILFTFLPTQFTLDLMDAIAP